jgi:DNA-cytosine methyltransferase
MSVVDLFAGVGGLSSGFVATGHTLLFASDFDRAASSTFMHNHPGVPFYLESIENLDPHLVMKELSIRKGDLDVLVGGVPCQAFSMAGIRIRKESQGQLDQRVYLFRHYLRFAQALSPKVIVIENVPGILSMLNGAVIDEIKTSLERLGYQVSWQLLNAADHGAPQLRTRAIIMANRISKPNVFPVAEFSKKTYKTIKEAFVGLPELNHEPRPLSGLTLERVKLLKQGENWKNLPEHLRTKSVHSGAYGRLRLDAPARTLTTRFDTPSVGYVTHPIQDRALTVREGARIQGFPDDFEFLGTRMQQYKQVGNAVSPYMSLAIAKSINKMIDWDN